MFFYTWFRVQKRMEAILFPTVQYIKKQHLYRTGTNAVLYCSYKKKLPLKLLSREMCWFRKAGLWWRLL